MCVAWLPNLLPVSTSFTNTLSTKHVAAVIAKDVGKSVAINLPPNVPQQLATSMLPALLSTTVDHRNPASPYTHIWTLVPELLHFFGM